jgi:predicted nucleic acid-binding protein
MEQVSIRIGSVAFDHAEYDSEHDILYLHVGEPQEAEGEETRRDTWSALHEVGRAHDSVDAMLEALRRSIGLGVADASMATLVDAAAALTWTRDPFDRLIAAHAIVAGAPLITADRTILEHLPQAVWD